MRFRHESNRLIISGRPVLPGAPELLAAAAAVVLGCGALFAAGPEPFESGGKWGFRETGTDLTVVPPIFDLAGEFRDGLAPVMLLGKWGYVDEAGRLALGPDYAEARPFSEGAAEVRLLDGQWAVIDKTGALIRVSSSPALGVLSGGVAVFVKDGKFGYADKDGRAAIPAEFDGAGPFREGLASVKKGKWGFINKSGKFVIKPEFDAVRDFSEGLAAFLKDGKWGYLDAKGNVAIGANFHEARDFSEGLAALRINARWGYIDKKGLIAVCPEYDDAGPFSEGLAVAVFPVLAPKGSVAQVVPERRWLNRKGEAVYKSSGTAGDGMEIIVSTRSKYGYARNSKPAVPPRFEAAGGCGNGVCLVKEDGKYSFMDYAGSTTYRTGFEEAAALGCGLYRIRQGLKYGLISSTGGVIAPALYDALAGSGCAERLEAALNGETGEFSAAAGLFTAGRAAPEAQPVKLGESCLLVEKTIAAMPYRDIPGHCGAEELRAILKTSTGCVSCRLALAEIYSSTAQAGAGDLGAALEALGEAIKLSTDTFRLYQWRVELLLSSAPAAAHAAGLAADYKQLIALEPANPAHYSGLCAAYALLGPEARAESSFAVHYCGKAVELEPTAGNYVNLGSLKRLLGDDVGALEAFRAAVKSAPENVPARLARARFSTEKGQDFRAVFDYTKILETDKDNPEFLEERGLAYLRMNSCAKARADLEHAGRARPGAGNAHKLAAYHWRCEKDPFKTLEIAESLLKAGDQCGGSCWRPEEYDVYLSDFYATPDYQNLLKKYQPPASPDSPVISRPGGL